MLALLPHQGVHIGHDEPRLAELLIYGVLSRVFTSIT